VIDGQTDQLSVAAATIEPGEPRDPAATSGHKAASCGNRADRAATIGHIGKAIMATGGGTTIITNITGMMTGMTIGMLTTSRIITTTGITARGAAIGPPTRTHPHTLVSVAGGWHP
jgi:hypothetical protein